MRKNLAVFGVIVALLAGITVFNMQFQPRRIAEREQAARLEELAKLQEIEALAEASKKEQQEAQEAEEAAKALAAKPVEVEAPDTFKVAFSTTKGDFVVECYKDWAPIGAKHFYNLVLDGFYNDAAFFRAMDDFMVQFGIAADPAMTAKWGESLKDDPDKQSNAAGTIVYGTTGMPNSRSAQVYINTKAEGNTFLDGRGYVPFGKVISGFDVVLNLNTEYGDAPSKYQTQITEQGNAYLEKNFPNLDYIKTATLVEAPEGAAAPSAQ